MYSTGNQGFASLFYEGLKSQLEKDKDTPVHTFLDKTKKLIDLLLFVLLCKELKQGQLYSAFCIQQLLNFFEDVDNYSLYEKYIQQLKEVLAKSQELPEEANCELKHSEIIARTREVGESELISSLLKVETLRAAAKKFAHSFLYEKAIEVLNEAKDIYQYQLFEYPSVAKMLVSSISYKIVEQTGEVLREDLCGEAQLLHLF